MVNDFSGFRWIQVSIDQEWTQERAPKRNGEHGGDPGLVTGDCPHVGADTLPTDDSARCDCPVAWALVSIDDHLRIVYTRCNQCHEGSLEFQNLGSLLIFRVLGHVGGYLEGKAVFLHEISKPGRRKRGKTFFTAISVRDLLEFRLLRRGEEKAHFGGWPVLFRKGGKVVEDLRAILEDI